MPSRFLCGSLATALVLLPASPSLGGASEPAAAVEVFATGHLSPPLALAELKERPAIGIQLWVTFDGKGGGEGRLELDKNQCTYSELGDASCTEMAPLTIAVTCKQVEIADPTKKGRRLFALAGTELKHDWSFVHAASVDGHRLPLRGDDGKVRCVLPMHRVATK